MTTRAALAEALREAGPDLSFRPRALFRAAESLGHADASLGLLLATGGLAGALHSAPPEVRARIAEGDLLTGSAHPGGQLRRTGGEGYVLSGCWVAVPAATSADWFALGAERDDGGPPEPVLVLLPAGVAGVSPRTGTGLDGADARHLAARDVAVPAEHVLPAFGPVPGPAPLPPVVAVRCAVTGVALGLARRALSEFAETARQRSRLGEVTRMSEQPVLRTELNRVVLSFRAARRLVLTELEGLPPDGDGQEAVPVALRTGLAAALLHAHGVAIDAVRFAFGKSGGSSLYSGHSMEGHWRDAEELACHHLFSERAEREIASAQFGDHVSPVWL
ncbi:acyl-CoA dehydrogenase family protein [Prauserella flavalba]|uniref:Acyl-CoA dehydrogenase C-terminal domain-containing protein n=1 Tax=Prauserella flavalba TaxID=1477506 RepID=A0A318LPK7_9PSEU|nr:acyl-CoA dehydrogenase family protein [Prauserella flavalba]PXY36321.1 hypothetical protein BA062_12975 [Prauserella flavalba]